MPEEYGIHTLISCTVNYQFLKKEMACLGIFPCLKKYCRQLGNLVRCKGNQCEVIRRLFFNTDSDLVLHAFFFLTKDLGRFYGNYTLVELLKRKTWKTFE